MVSEQAQPKSVPVVKLLVYLSEELSLMRFRGVSCSLIELVAEVLVEAVRHLGLSTLFVEVCYMAD